MIGFTDNFLNPMFYLPRGLFEEEESPKVLGELPNGVVNEAPSKFVRPEKKLAAEQRKVQGATQRALPRQKASPAKPIADRTASLAVQMSASKLHGIIRSFNGTAQELEEIFLTTPLKNAKGEELRNVYFYSAFIKRAKSDSAFFNIAKKAFKEAVMNEKTNNILCNSYIVLAGRNKNFKEAKKGFNETIAWGICDQETFNTYIHAAGVNNQFDEVEMAFNTAGRLGKIDVVTLNTYIAAAGHNNRLKEAQAIYNMMTKKGCGLADAFTFSGYIKAAGQCVNFDEVQRAYEESKVLLPRARFNSYISNNYIDAAGECRQFDAAKKGFQEANNELRIADAYTQMAFERAAKKCGIEL